MGPGLDLGFIGIACRGLHNLHNLHSLHNQNRILGHSTYHKSISAINVQMDCERILTCKLGFPLCGFRVLDKGW